MLGSFLDYVGICLDNFGIVFEQFWELYLDMFCFFVEQLLESVWDNVGLSFGPFGDKFWTMGGHWDSISEALGSQGVKVHLSTFLLRGFWEPFWRPVGLVFCWPPWCVFCVTFVEH